MQYTCNFVLIHLPYLLISLPFYCFIFVIIECFFSLLSIILLSYLCLQYVCNISEYVHNFIILILHSIIILNFCLIYFLFRLVLFISCFFLFSLFIYIVITFFFVFSFIYLLHLWSFQFFVVMCASFPRLAKLLWNKKVELRIILFPHVNTKLYLKLLGQVQARIKLVQDTCSIGRIYI